MLARWLVKEVLYSCRNAPCPRETIHKLVFAVLYVSEEGIRKPSTFALKNIEDEKLRSLINDFVISFHCVHSEIVDRAIDGLEKEGIIKRTENGYVLSEDKEPTPPRELIEELGDDFVAKLRRKTRLVVEHLGRYSDGELEEEINKRIGIPNGLVKAMSFGLTVNNVIALLERANRNIEKVLKELKLT